MKSTTKSILAAISAIVLSATAFGAASQPPDQPVLIDTSSSAGSVVASSSSSATYSAAHAFDGLWSASEHRWLAYNNPNNDYGSGVHGESPMYLVYNFNAPTKVNVLRLRIQNANEWDTRSPKAWTFLGSNDGTTWTTLDSRSGVAWASGTTVKTFAFENETKYAYYKFNCTEIVGSNNYMQLYEIQFLYDSGIVLTDLTTPSGTVTTTTAGDWVKPAKNAFDNGTAHNNDDRSIHSGTTVDWIYTFDTPTKVNAYKVHVPGSGAYNYDKRMPKTWTFEAKNAADSEWTVLDTQDSETGWTALESRYYEFPNNTEYDSYRFAVTANQAESDAYIQIDELEFFYLNRGIPVLGAVALARTGALAYSLSATEDMNAADLAYILNDGATLSTNGTTSVNEGGSTTWTLSGFASADTTYQVSVLATNTNDKVEKVAGTLYTGELTLGATANANEYGLVAGGVTVSRANADPFPLTVNYAISGSAGSEGTTWAAPEPVTIPANAASVVLPVVPLIDGSVTEDVTITVTLAAGNYEIPASAAATLTLVNLVAPSGYNVWVAQDNGLASVGSNWSAGHAPTTLEKVLFDGDFSTKNCEWDAAASATVSNWTQNANYTGTVTFDTEFPSYANATFPLFTIAGDCAILGGKWSCRGNYNNFGATVTPMNTSATAKRWCLNVSVGGAMTIASGAYVTVTGRGYGYPSTNPGASQAYGGYAHGGTTTPYGSITEPFDPGMGALSQGDQKNKISGIGGGAVKLTISGNLTVDGSIVALGTIDNNVVRSGGTGGSIWIAANQISGSGTIDASACPKSQLTSDQAVSTGSGGRIALYTQSPLAFPMAKVSCNGTSYAGTSWNSKTKVGGPGTIYVKDPTQTHGTLYVKQSRDIATIANKWTGTPVMGDLELDAVVLSGNAQLRIPAGTSLTLPSLSAVTTESDAAGISGIICAGGTLDIGNGDQVLKTNVAFSSPTPFSFPGNLTLETGARLGALNGVFSCAAGHFDTNFTLAVAGDLDIPSGAVAGATRCCSILLSGTATRGGHGGSSLYNSITVSNAYDSVLNPFMTGSSTVYGFRAGGVFNLTVGGTLTLDGTISADGSDTRGNNNTWDNAPAASAGSLNLRLGALSGSGSITAHGGSGAYNYAGGTGGGRVAVRLTGNGSTFSDHWKANITAYGVSYSTARNGKASSAGTVYL